MLSVGGEGLAIVVDAIPERFPAGVDVIIYQPGDLSPLGRGSLPRGCMLAIVPPGMSAQIRNELRKLMSKQAARTPGSIAAPGTPGA
jgi:hypothetical protein